MGALRERFPHLSRMTLTAPLRLPAVLIVLAAFQGWLECGRALTFSQALDTPGVEWTSSVPDTWKAVPGGRDGVDMVEIANQAGGPHENETPILSAQITGPAKVRLWWRYTTSVTDPAFFPGVDDTHVRVWPRYYGPDGWMPLEIQLSAGPHKIGFYPFIGTVIQLDQITITPQPGSLVEGAGDPLLSWMLPYGGSWVAGGEAPPGGAASAMWESGGNYPEVHCLFPPDSKIEGWFKMTKPGYFSISSEMTYFYQPARREAPDWQRFRLVAPARWITFSAQGSTNGNPLLVDLKLGGITVVPATPGDVLDAPELTWTASGAPPFVLGNDDFSEQQTSSLSAAGRGAFTSSLHTSVNGPGRLFFDTYTYKSVHDRWEVFLNGSPVEFDGIVPGELDRYSLAVPAGAVNMEFRATNADEFDTPDYGYFVFDDVTMCIPAAAAQKDALDLPGAAAMWVRQSDAGMWSRSTSVSRDGVDSLALAPSSGPRRGDLMLPTEGAAIVGMWMKTDPETRVMVSPFGDGERPHIRVIHPSANGAWNWVPLYAGPESTDLRLTLPVYSDKGRELYLDSYAIYKTEVPVADALETPGRVWQGAHGLALPGSDAGGEKAVLLVQGAQIDTTISAPVRVKFRYRLCGPTVYSEAYVRINNATVAVVAQDLSAPSPSITWQEGEVLQLDTAENQTLTFRGMAGAVLLDKVEIIPLIEVSVPEALDVPGLTVVQSSWTGVTGLGHDESDTVLSSALVRGFPNSSAVSQLLVNVPPGGCLDAGFWWRRERDLGNLDFRIPSDGSTVGSFSYNATGWQPVRVHRDRSPAQLMWAQTVFWANVAQSIVPKGHVKLDELALVSGVADSFSKALDTDQSGPGMTAIAWNAIGEAGAAVQTSVTWQDGDALEIRATSGGQAQQVMYLSAPLGSGTDFSCRVKRGPQSASSLILQIGELGNPEVPLTTEWTEFRLLLPAGYATAAQNEITFLATVANAGPDAVIYLDAVSLKEAVDMNAALETTGLAWTGAGQGRHVIAGERAVDDGRFPSYHGYFDGVSLRDLTNGQRRRLDTVVSGPATMVLTGYRPPDEGGDWQSWLIVDGLIRDALPKVAGGPFQHQALLPAGVHTVRWLVERTAEGAAEPGSIQLHSAAVVPGLPADLMPAALETIAPGRTWAVGGSHPPAPLYSVKEGATSLTGIFFPAWGFGESSWLETNIAGPARVNFTWQSTALAACYMDGRTACRTRAGMGLDYHRDPRTALEVPAGPHTLRWAASQGGTAKLRAFSTTPGSAIAGVLDGASPPIAWLFDPETDVPQSWQVMTDGSLFGYGPDGGPLEVPGTGLPVLGGVSLALGSFWVTGPAVVSYAVRSDSAIPLFVTVGQETYFPEPGYGEGTKSLHWRPNAFVVPAGQHLVSFSLPDQGGAEPHLRLANIRIAPGLPWLTWAFGIGLIDINDSSPFADPDNDGMMNLMEFAFGTQPRSSNPQAVPLLAGPPENRGLQFPSLPWDATSLTYDVQVSSDMAAWTSLATVRPNPAHQPGPFVPLPASQGGRVFYRITVRL